MSQTLVATPTVSEPASRSTWLVWTGRALTFLVAAFLLFDGAIKLVPIAAVIEAMPRLGYAVELARPIGLVLVACTALHLLPRTQLLGALLVTAYLGGATASHVRVGAPYWFPILMGVILWAGFACRSPRLRALLGAPSAS